MDSLDSTEYRRLTSSVQWSYGQLKDARRNRKTIIQRVCGPYYPIPDRIKDRRPINMLELGADLFRRNLASHQPECIVSTEYPELLPVGSDFETVLNRKISTNGIDIQSTFNICALEALISFGVVCTGISVEGDYDPGKVFSEPVLLPDLILDMNARSWDTQSYIGHEFEVPLDWVLSSPLFDPTEAKRFVTDSQARWRQNSEDWQSMREQQFEDTVRLRQLYLPRKNCIVLSGCENDQKPLHVAEWQGPPKGPYRPLSFRSVPGKVLPLAPMLAWLDLDEIINKVYWKEMRRAMRSKVLGLTQSPDDANAVKAANDGEVVNVQDPKAVNEMRYGGADNNQLSMVLWAKQQLVWLGGNWDAIGGLAPQSGTLGQDKLLAEGASGRLREMQQTMTEFQTNVISDVAFWIWQDPLSQERFTKRLAGTNFGISATWGPESRQGEFFQYNFRVNPYSKINRSPEEEAQQLTQLLETVILPSIPYMQQGGPVDFELFFKLLARYTHRPELNSMIRWPQGESIPQSMPDTPKMAARTQREHIRTNRTAPQDGDNRLMEMLMSGSNGNGNGNGAHN